MLEQKVHGIYKSSTAVEEVAHTGFEDFEENNGWKLVA